MAFTGGNILFVGLPIVFVSCEYCSYRNFLKFSLTDAQDLEKLEKE